MVDPSADNNAVRVANDAFYKALSAGSIEGISAACAHDDDVTALHEASKEVAIGWQAVLDTWKAVPFDAFLELSVVMSHSGDQSQRIDRPSGRSGKRQREDEGRKGIRMDRARNKHL